jgi:hypothetical protein
MKIEQMCWSAAHDWVRDAASSKLRDTADLVLVFGSTGALQNAEHLEEVQKTYPQAFVFGCSTAGEICGTSVADDSIAVTAVEFERTEMRHASIAMINVRDSFDAGERLAALLPHEGLVHVFVLSDGLDVNGTDLVNGLASGLPSGVSITGGLSGDGDRFESTLVVLEGKTEGHAIGVVGLYGPNLQVGYASLGGWDSFGPERLVTRSEGNVLYELDGKSALALYKQYLGDQAAGLPGTGLLFPLSLRTKDRETPFVRTILAVDEDAQSLTFAGDIPTGAYARLMKANFDRLIDGAVGAARATQPIAGSSPELAILISCVGRKMVLKQRIEEEVEGVREVLGESTTLTGFYSYGEISPFTPNARCELHNQTMTITTLSERAA